MITTAIDNKQVVTDLIDALFTKQVDMSVRSWRPGGTRELWRWR